MTQHITGQNPLPLPKNRPLEPTTSSQETRTGITIDSWPQSSVFGDTSLILTQPALDRQPRRADRQARTGSPTSGALARSFPPPPSRTHLLELHSVIANQSRGAPLIYTRRPIGSPISGARPSASPAPSAHTKRGRRNKQTLGSYSQNAMSPRHSSLNRTNKITRHQ